MRHLYFFALLIRMLFTCILYCSDPEPCPPSPLSPRHCNVLAIRWTTQHATMTRILKLKKPLVEYFRRHSSNERKLNSHEWKVTNELYSLLDVVAEVTIRIQGGADTHLRQTMFNMREIHEIFGEDSHAIRKLDQAYNQRCRRGDGRDGRGRPHRGGSTSAESSALEVGQERAWNSQDAR